MGRNAAGGGAGWTELFFLDEVTALAAGHRPCFFCRREDARRFLACFPNAAAAPAMDQVLHAQRRVSGGKLTRMTPEQVTALPDGAVVSIGEKFYAVRQRRLLAWTFQGYGEAREFSSGDTAMLVTPPATVAALRAGYGPVWHSSALTAPP